MKAFHFSTLSQGLLALLAGSAFTTVGREWVERVLSHLRLGRKFQPQWQTGLALAVLLLVLGLRFALPRIARYYNDGGVRLQRGGQAYFYMGQLEEAMTTQQEALNLAREEGSRSVEADALANIADIYDNLGQYELALEYYQQSLPIQRELGDRAGEGTTLSSIGMVYFTQKQYEQALNNFQQALVVIRKTGDRAHEGTMFSNIGAAYYNLERYEQALDSYRQALAIRREIDDSDGIFETLHNIKMINQARGQPEQALNDFQQVLDDFQQRLAIASIIPHGVLHYLPFSALTDGQCYLGDDFILFSLPSASVLPFIQQKRKGRGDSLLALAHSQAEGLPTLYYAEREVQEIAQLYSTEAVLGNNATETIFKVRSSDFNLLHLAAHGELNPVSAVFSRLILAPDKDADGSLEVHEVYGLDLNQADLVLLSACQTQLGAHSRGDDIVGLNRALIYAGTPTTIASLWRVDDKATGVLMTSFYTHLKNGMSKAEALQTAQQETRDQYPHPYYWAAFVLTGDKGKATASVR